MEVFRVARSGAVVDFLLFLQFPDSSRQLAAQKVLNSKCFCTVTIKARKKTFTEKRWGGIFKQSFHGGCSSRKCLLELQLDASARQRPLALRQNKQNLFISAADDLVILLLSLFIPAVSVLTFLYHYDN